MKFMKMDYGRACAQVYIVSLKNTNEIILFSL